MVQNGLVELEVSPNDKRAKYVHLTEKSRSQMKQIKSFFDRIDRSLLEGVSEEELAIFEEVLDKLQANVKKIGGEILLTVLFTCFSVYLELEVPTYISEITELLGTPGTQLDALWSPAIKMIGLSLLAFLSSVTVGFFAARVAASYTTHLRSDIFNRVLRDQTFFNPKSLDSDD